jgi:hypothetical protein
VRALAAFRRVDCPQILALVWASPTATFISLVFQRSGRISAGSGMGGANERNGLKT